MSLIEEQFSCAYCGAPNSLSIDVSGGQSQKFLTDCEVCCHPLVVKIELSGEEILSIEVFRENE